jgi:hypothetical protein
MSSDTQSQAQTHDDLQFILQHMESVVSSLSGRKPSGRPLLVFPSGKVRIEFFGTFNSLHAARNALERHVPPTHNKETDERGK